MATEIGFTYGTVMRLVCVALSAAITLGALATTASAGFAVLSAKIGNGASILESAHLKPGNHCHRHGHGKLCHRENDYPRFYGLLDRDKRPVPHRHTRLCRH